MLCFESNDLHSLWFLFMWTALSALVCTHAKPKQWLYTKQQQQDNSKWTTTTTCLTTMAHKIAAVISEEICILHKLQYVKLSAHFTLHTPQIQDSALRTENSIRCPFRRLLRVWNSLSLSPLLLLSGMKVAEFLELQAKCFLTLYP